MHQFKVVIILQYFPIPLFINISIQIMLQNSHPQLLVNLQAASSLHKLHSQILTSKLSNIFNSKASQNIEIGKIQRGEEFKSYRELAAEDEDIEKQMRDEYESKIGENEEMRLTLESEIERMRERLAREQVKRLASMDILKERELKLVILKKQIKQKEGQIKYSGVDELLESSTVQTNQAMINHLKNRLQTNKSAIFNLKSQIQAIIKNNQYLQNLIQTRNSLKNKYTHYQQKSKQLDDVLESCKNEAVNYVRESEEDIGKVVEKEMPKALDEKFRSRDELSSAYNCLYEIISKEVMESGKFELFRQVQGMEQI